MKRNQFFLTPAVCVILITLFMALPAPVASAPAILQGDNPNPPAEPVKLIFIHHSTGENWLADGYGNLGQTLAENNYFVSDTNYGWGPDSIGDRTDIPNWVEWFASDQTAIYMDALFNESEQHAGYTRLFGDPGGENQIVLFKSCFPNSALEGSPSEPPNPEGWLSVGHAKYVYNEILRYFAARPDKLFIVITAPPLSDGTYARNARAFNDWLLNDWLAENNYALPNVAVFDFYNVLTARNAHHWYHDGASEHPTTNSNTLAYPSGDDHPSEKGSQKATDEFIPLLNIFYNRWADGQPAQPTLVEAPGGTPLPSETLAPVTVPQGDGAGVPLPPETVLTIADFESGSHRWEAFRDEATSTTVTCATEQGTGSNGSVSLRIDFSVSPASWSTCAFFFDTPQDWSAGEWLTFDIHSEKEFQPFNVIVYSGTPDSRETYIQKGETPVEYLGYGAFMSMWKDLLRAEWEDRAGSPFEQPGQVTGLAFGFDAGPDAPYTGSVWIDNIRLMKSPTYPGSENPPKNGLPCLGSILLPLAMVSVAWVFRRK